MTSTLPAKSDTLTSLSTSHYNGLVAVATFGFMSFVATSTLFSYLTYKLIRWHVDRPQVPKEKHNHGAMTDLSLGLTQLHFSQSKPTATTRPDNATLGGDVPDSRGDLNQFLLLVYNLLFAEMHQSMAFLLNVSWVASNGIWVGTPTCWAQGWFVSVGDLAASCFITAIAVHTYLAVVRGYRPPQWALYATIGGLWFFVYALGMLGVMITNNGRDAGGLYVRAVAWCWMNVKYENFRLWLHYFWIFGSLALTSGLYIMIFFSVRRRDTPIQSAQNGRAPRADIVSDQAIGSHPGFLIYPIIYGFCTAPLAMFRVATMSGRAVSVELFCFAASMIASNGWLDVLLFSWTRSSIIFAPSLDSADTGIDTFAFMRTPHTRRFGNMVWVQGASRSNDTSNNIQNGGWWRLGGERTDRKSKSRCHRWPGSEGSISQESLRGAGVNGIQMDTVTSVVVEGDPSNKELALSVNSSDRGFETSSGKMR